MADGAAALGVNPQSKKALGTSTPSAAARRVRPLTKIISEDRREYSPIEFIEPDGTKTTTVRVNNITPLIWLAERCRDKLEPHQAEAGRKAEQDFHRARSASLKVADVSAQALYRTAGMMRDTKTWEGRSGASGEQRAYTQSMGRLDAIKRLGALMQSVGPVSFFFLEAVIANETGLADLAKRVAEDQKYVSARFREALDAAAKHYGLLSRNYVGLGV